MSWTYNPKLDQWTDPDGNISEDGPPPKRMTDQNRLHTGYYDKPIEMYSVGLVPGEYSAFRRANPEIDLTPDGVPIARTRQQKKQVLKYMGWQETN